MSPRTASLNWLLYQIKLGRSYCDVYHEAAI
jgi:hypothetical protein